jgi:hypothetical protein
MIPEQYQAFMGRSIVESKARSRVNELRGNVNEASCDGIFSIADIPTAVFGKCSQGGE